VVAVLSQAEVAQAQSQLELQQEVLEELAISMPEVLVQQVLE
jgi:hypothetical protein